MQGGVGHAGISQPPAPNKWTIALLLQLTHASSGTLTQAHLTPWEGPGPIVQRLSREPPWLTPFLFVPHGALQVLLRRLCQPFPLQPQPGHALPKRHSLATICVHPHSTGLLASHQATAVPPSPSGLAILTARPPQSGPLPGNHTLPDPDR